MSRTPVDPASRFVQKIEISDEGCWNWQAGLSHNGYGKFTVNGSDVRAHRWSYSNFVGPIADGMTVDHLCNNRRCVNPDHLQTLTQTENVLAEHSESTARKNSLKTECPKGHPYTDENTYRYKNGRTCKTCATSKVAA
jgi:hypothetical protein